MSFTSLLIVLRILKFSDLIINKGVKFADVGTVFIALIPTFLEFAFPMSTLLGVMLCIARLSGDSEIVVIRASGISLFQLLKPCLYVGSIMLFFALIISITLRPWGYRTLSETLYNIARDKTTVGLQEGTFQKLGLLTLYAENIHHKTGYLKNVLIDDQRSEEERKVIFSKKGKIIADNKNQKINFNLRLGEIHEQTDDNYSFTEFQQNQISLGAQELFDPDAKEKNIRFRELAFSDLKPKTKDLVYKLENLPLVLADYNEQRKKLIKDIRGIKIEKTRRFSFPFACFILPFMALALGIQAPRAKKTWGTSISILLALLVFITYFGLVSFAVTLGEKGTLPASITLWVPNVILVVICYHLLKRLGEEKWQAIQDPIQEIFDKIYSFVSKFSK